MAKEGEASASTTAFSDAAAAGVSKEEEEAAAVTATKDDIRYECYQGEEQLPIIMDIIDQELSEPYSIFTYRYFLRKWPKLCFLAFHKDKCVGTVVCKMDWHKSNTFRGYIAMLVVIKPYRGKRIATELVTRAIEVMREEGCEEVTLEAEVTNKGALALYGNLGFIRVKRLFRYYLNGVDAFRLKLLFPRPDLRPLLALNEESYNLDHSRSISIVDKHNWDLHSQEII